MTTSKPYNQKEKTRLARNVKLINILPTGMTKEEIKIILRRYENEQLTPEVVSQIEFDIGRKTLPPGLGYEHIEYGDGI